MNAFTYVQIVNHVKYIFNCQICLVITLMQLSLKRVPHNGNGRKENLTESENTKLLGTVNTIFLNQFN